MDAASKIIEWRKYLANSEIEDLEAGFPDDPTDMT